MSAGSSTEQQFHDAEMQYCVGIEAGSYTVAYTCQAALDDPAVDDALSFNGTTTVSAAAKTTTVHDF